MYLGALPSKAFSIQLSVQSSNHLIPQSSLLLQPRHRWLNETFVLIRVKVRVDRVCAEYVVRSGTRSR